MLASLRFLLVALVTAAPLLAGLQAVAADHDAVAVIGAAGSSPLDGHREDDAGTLLEESGELDAEEDEVRIDHPWMTLARDLGGDAPGRFSPSRDRPVQPTRRAAAALSRGPPDRR